MSSSPIWGLYGQALAEPLGDPYAPRMDADEHGVGVQEGGEALGHAIDETEDLGVSVEGALHLLGPGHGPQAEWRG